MSEDDPIELAPPSARMPAWRVWAKFQEEPRAGVAEILETLREFHQQTTRSYQTARGLYAAARKWDSGMVPNHWDAGKWWLLQAVEIFAANRQATRTLERLLLQYVALGDAEGFRIRTMERFHFGERISSFNPLSGYHADKIMRKFASLVECAASEAAAAAINAPGAHFLKDAPLPLEHVRDRLDEIKTRPAEAWLKEFRRQAKIWIKDLAPLSREEFDAQATHLWEGFQEQLKEAVRRLREGKHEKQISAAKPINHAATEAAGKRSRKLKKETRPVDPQTLENLKNTIIANPCNMNTKALADKCLIAPTTIYATYTKELKRQGFKFETTTGPGKKWCPPSR